jgi:hypothetical protein
MGLLFSLHKTNRSILTTEQRRYKEYIIDIELIEYDRVERLLLFRNREKMVGVNFRAFTPDTELCEYCGVDGEYRQPISVDCVASETFAWPKANGQDDWDMTICYGLESLIDNVEDDSEDDEQAVKQEFTDALQECDLP